MSHPQKISYRHFRIQLRTLKKRGELDFGIIFGSAEGGDGVCNGYVCHRTYLGLGKNVIHIYWVPKTGNDNGSRSSKSGQGPPTSEEGATRTTLELKGWGIDHTAAEGNGHEGNSN